MRIVDSVSCGNSKKMVKPIALTTLADLVELMPFVCCAQIVASLVEGRIDAGLWVLCAVMGALLIATFIVEHAAINASFSDGYRVSAESRTRLAEHIRRLPLGVLDDAGQATLTTTLMSDVALTERGMTHILPQVASGIILVVIATVALAAIDVRLAVAAFAGMPAALLAIACGLGIRRRSDARLSAARVEVAASVQDFLYGIEATKVSGGEDTIVGAIDRACAGYRDACIAQERVTGALNALAGSAVRLGLPAILVCGSALLATGDVDLGVMVLFLMVGTRMYDPLAAALMNWSELEMSARAGERVLGIMAQAPLPGTGELTGEELELDGVSFSYDGSERALDAASLRVPAGSRTAVVGPSGSGKSTVLKIAARFYDPDAGIVRLGGADVSQAAPESLYRSVSMVFQDVYLFHDTVEANIRYGREDASHEEVVAAARAARCHDFIMALPDGYATMVGERGSTLSGGERQRIAIARAILKDAPIILLDEAMSALDPINEREVQQAVSALCAGRTVIMVAHDLSSVRGMDQIAVLEGGKIVQLGTHAELMAEGGLYARLFTLQRESDGWRIA